MCDHQINFSSIYMYRSLTYILWPSKFAYVSETIYSRKVVLGMIDQFHSNTDIVNYKVTSMDQTRMTRLPWMTRTSLRVRRTFSDSSRKQVFKDLFLIHPENVSCVYSF